MYRMCEKAEPTVQIGSRAVIADNVKLEGSTSIHYRRLNEVFCYFVSMSIQAENATFIRIAPSLAEFSEYMIRANTTGSTTVEGAVATAF
jgi:hypothetical protein